MRGFARAIQAALNDIYGNEKNLKAMQEFINRVGSKGNIHGLVVYDIAAKPVAVSESLQELEGFPDLDPKPILQIDPRQVLKGGEGMEGYADSPSHLIYYRAEPIFNSDNNLI